MDDGKRAELLMDHYKDTFALILHHWKARNRLFVYILLLLTIVAVDSLSPGSLSSVVNGYLKTKFIGEAGKWQDLAFSVIGLMARFLLLCLVIQYYQRSIFVDRSYKYISHLEEQICDVMGGDYVTREGKSYFSRSGVPVPGQEDERPCFLRWVGGLYVYVFPVTLSGLVILKLALQDWPPWASLTGALIAACSVGIVGYTVLYLVWIVKHK